MKPSMTAQSNCLSSQPGYTLSPLLLYFFTVFLPLCIYPSYGLIYLFIVHLPPSTEVTREVDFVSPVTIDPRAELGSSHTGRS